jgi:adenosylhomocysteine nucleosidase
MESHDPLVVMALPLEGGDLFVRAQIPVLYTGIGKINAAHHLAVKLTEYRLAGVPLPLVVNFGSAGSPTFATGLTVACTSFCQRDMDASALGFEPGETPFDESPTMLTFPPLNIDLPHAICGTGDSFATCPPGVRCDVVDMEAYALAKVCWLQGARFASFKYITDGADGAAADAWKRNVVLAAERFLEIYRRLLSRPPGD